jgi:diguanylate cyclase (GGDEF)-like protein
MSDLDQKILEMFKPHERFCKAMIDAYIVINAHGKVLKSNHGVQDLLGMTMKNLQKCASLSDVLTLSLDQPLTISEILSNTSAARFDNVVGKTTDGKELSMIIGYHPFIENDQVIGAFLLIRNMTAENSLQSKYKTTADRSLKDTLTGIFNRAFIEDQLSKEDKNLLELPTGSEHRNLSFVMGDIDHFKKINDKYGHPAGDYVIKTVAQLCENTFRKTDYCCRYGGEEFLIILPASKIDGAAIAAEKARATIAAHDFVFEGQKIPVTMSMGVAQFKVGSEMAKEAIKRADEALYHAKANGRNQVSLHDGEHTTSNQFKPNAA